MGSRLQALQRAKDQSHTLPLSPPKGGSETLLRCFTNKTGIVSIKVCYKVYFALKLSKKALILRLMPHRVAQKCFMI